MQHALLSCLNACLLHPTHAGDATSSSSGKLPSAMLQLEEVYGEIARVLKPGGLFATYEWVATKMFDPDNPEHVRIIDEINYGNGLPVRPHYNGLLTQTCDTLSQALLYLPAYCYQPIELADIQSLSCRVGDTYTKPCVATLAHGLAHQVRHVR